jgi:hypothetical protein
MGWAHSLDRGDRNATKFLWCNLLENDLWKIKKEDYIEMDLTDKGFEDGKWSKVVQDGFLQSFLSTLTTSFHFSS